jgi:hypothetical protein
MLVMNDTSRHVRDGQSNAKQSAIHTAPPYVMRQPVTVANQSLQCQEVRRLKNDNATRDPLFALLPFTRQDWPFMPH